MHHGTVALVYDDSVALHWYDHQRTLTVPLNASNVGVARIARRGLCLDHDQPHDPSTIDALTALLACAGVVPAESLHFTVPDEWLL